MNKTFTPLSTAALVTLLTLAVTGAGRAAGMMDDTSSGKALNKVEQQAFMQLDTNQDGKISQEEAKKNPGLAARFTKVDSNHDNAVDEGEFARFETETETEK